MMPAFSCAMLCGIAGAFAGNLAYARSNLFVLGVATRPERHLLWDPLAFTALGGLFGVVAGVVVGLGFTRPNPLVPIGTALAVTLGGIAAVGAFVTWQRDRELPRDPALAGPRLDLEFELRLPAAHAPDAPLPRSGVMGTGVVHATDAVLAKPATETNGRTVVPGRVRLRFAVANRLLSVLDGHGCWINFDIPLPAVPTATEAWTDWFAPCNPDPRLPPEQDHQLRCRVVPVRGR